ncbi:MAG: glucose 1-dehydrogenase [Betaproteobacteria bacterium]|nr:glucose 1-dehydrogenase [Betaproteobacteria bacterium]
MRLANKVALITGAGSGLGEATAHRLAEEGAHVVASDIDAAAVARVVAAIVAKGGSAEAQQQDVTDEARWQALIADMLARLGQIDILVNNAGIVMTGSAEDTSVDDWRRTQQVNLDAVFVGTREAIRAMKHRGGSIINISSIDGIIGEPMAAAYSASKGGVRIFTKSAALHCANKGYRIRVNSLHPGVIRTPMVENAFAALPPADRQALIARLEAQVPLGAWGEPVDIANGVLFLASDESRYMTGAELVIDGGYTAK